MNNVIQIKPQGLSRIIIKRLPTIEEAAQYLGICVQKFENLVAVEIEHKMKLKELARGIIHRCFLRETRDVV